MAHLLRRNPLTGLNLLQPKVTLGADPEFEVAIPLRG